MQAKGLTEKEKEIYNLIIQGRSSKQIKVEQKLALSTLRRYFKSIFAKNLVSTKAELRERVKKEGLL